MSGEDDDWQYNPRHASRPVSSTDDAAHNAPA
eukprot:CAMPEP_0177732122 /NCGR_PEP_ID=MMETSP0484_2-20121128/22933_1 /TAXON_ID=354590 /ORGANISM="Rhodomonas lens, Strain RHODO" /LENGTH=31 /DNA_ID= /DNA_START= /DNA_END= /DNA_ORIENTATION=